MVWGWGDTTILWNSHPCPGTVIRGRGGTLESVRDGGGSSASMGVVPKEPLPPAYTALGWPRSQPLLGDARGRPVPRNSRFSVSHLEILNIISFFPFLLQRSTPCTEGTKSQLGHGTPKELCLLLLPYSPKPGTMPFCWVTPGLGLNLCLVPHTKSKAQTGGTHCTATMQTSSSQCCPHPATAALPEEGKSFTPMFPVGGYHVSHHSGSWDISARLSLEECMALSAHPGQPPVPATSLPFVKSSCPQPILPCSPSPITASLN